MVVDQRLDARPTRDDGGDGHPAQSAKFLAHDLNNVLQIIGGNLDLLERHLPFGHDAREHLQLAMTGVALGSSMTAAALAMTTAATSKRLPLDEQLAGFADLISAAAGPDVVVRLTIGAALPAVNADVSDLKNVILNLVLNARDAMDGLGELDVSLGNCPIGQHVLVTVTDNGPGIAPEDIRKIFDPGFSTKDSTRQRGFGLASVKAFAKRTDAKIAIDSGPRGTAIALRIPAIGPLIESCAA